MRKLGKSVAASQGQAVVEYLLMAGVVLTVSLGIATMFRKTVFTVWTSLTHTIVAGCPTGCPSGMR